MIFFSTHSFISSLGVSYLKNLPSSRPTSTISKSKYREKMKKSSAVGMDW